MKSSIKTLIGMLACAGAPLAMAAATENYTGAQPLICTPLHGHDCLPTKASCSPLRPDKSRDMNLTINVAEKTVKSPYRNGLLTIQNSTNNTESLVLQGTSIDVVWSATIHRTTGRLTVAIADRLGAYVVFGQCKLAGESGSAKKTK